MDLTHYPFVGRRFIGNAREHLIKIQRIFAATQSTVTKVVAARRTTVFEIDRNPYWNTSADSGRGG